MKQERIEYQIIKQGLYRPVGSKIPIRKLEKTIKYLKRWDKLSKAIAYSMVTPVGERYGEEWSIAFRSANYQNNRWNNIAVYSLIEEAHTLSDVVIVDYTVLRTKDKEQFLSKYPQLRELLLLELKLITYGRIS